MAHEMLVEDFARWYQPLELGSDPETRERRRNGVAALASQVGVADVECLVRLAFKTKQAPTSDEVSRIRKVMKAVDPDFPTQGNDREMQLLGGATLAELFRRGGDVAATAALTVSTTAAGGARRPELPLDLALAAESAMDTLSEVRRRRLDPAKKVELSFPADEFDKVIEKVDHAGAVEAIKLIVTAAHTALTTAANRCADALGEARAYSAIQDEELQMLWWLVGERSWDLDRPFSDVPLPERALVLAKELAHLTAVSPGPTGVKALLSRANLKDQDEVTIADCVNACDVDWLAPLVEGVDPSPITRPIHFAIKRKLETGENSAWIPGWSATSGLDQAKKLSSLSIAMLFYSERLLANLLRKPV